MPDSGKYHVRGHCEDYDWQPISNRQTTDNKRQATDNDRQGICKLLIKYIIKGKVILLNILEIVFN